MRRAQSAVAGRHGVNALRVLPVVIFPPHQARGLVRRACRLGPQPPGLPPQPLISSQVSAPGILNLWGMSDPSENLTEPSQ